MTAAHAFELPPDAAMHSDVVYLTRDGETIAAIVPADAVEVLEQAEDAYLTQLAHESMAEMDQDGGKT